MGKLKNFSIYVLFTALCVKSVNSIECYQCSGTDSDNPFECNEYLENDIALAPTDCATIHDAQFCIKHVGRYEGVALECFQCNSSATMECGDGLMSLDGGALIAISCDHVYEARFCIKQIVCLHSALLFNYFHKQDALILLNGNKRRIFTGGISTKRFCSSLDLGNYCNYVQQPGDKLKYRTCIYTCNSDGCNASMDLRIPNVFLITIIYIIMTFNYYNYF